jgi:hypothetical protein
MAIDTSPEALMARPDWGTIKDQITGGIATGGGREQMLANATNLGLSAEQAAQVVNTAMGGKAAFTAPDVQGWAQGGTTITKDQLGTSSPTYDSTNTPDWNALNTQIQGSWGTPQGQAAIFARGKELGMDDNAMAEAISRATGQPMTAAQVAGWGGKNVGDPLAPKLPGSTTSSGIISGAQSGASQLGNPTPWNVTPDQTVESRIQSIINPNNPIIQQARSRAQQSMNNRGLLNSSIANSAADSAAYDAAIPIATADAATFAKAAGYNADQSNQFAVRNVDSQNQLNIAELQTNTQKAIAGMNIDAQKQAAALQQANQTLLSTNDKAASAFSTAMSAINNIQNNNQMDADTKTRAMGQVWADVQTQLRVLGSVAGLDLTSQLDFANKPGFDSKGNFVGFGPAAPAAPPAVGGNGNASNGGSSNGVDAGG